MTISTIHHANSKSVSAGVLEVKEEQGQGEGQGEGEGEGKDRTVTRSKRRKMSEQSELVRNTWWVGHY